MHNSSVSAHYKRPKTLSIGSFITNFPIFTQMDNTLNRWHLRFENYCVTLQTLEDAIKLFADLNELEKDGLIQRFEFTFELAWKVMQDYLKYAGYKDIKGPRLCITQMGRDGYIDPFMWEEILTARNELSHIYNEQKSRLFLVKIIAEFYPLLFDFKNNMAALL
jgi:nucleotidyltransferase substrate binding protein (TIGR01987 family)